jgi:hypothetical protein
MIPLEEMPEDNAGLANVEIEFRCLEADTAESCPVPLDEIIDYLRLESSDLDAVHADQLRFVRTAQVAEQSYWIWAFRESDGSDCYVTVAVSPDGSASLAYAENYYGLSPEQHMLGDYHGMF